MVAASAIGFATVVIVVASGNDTAPGVPIGADENFAYP
jgi:hypothetical protein